MGTRTRILAASVALSACGGAKKATPSSPPAAPAVAPAVPADTFGLAHFSVFEAPAPPAYKPVTIEPGEAPLPPPRQIGAPPVIPHGVLDYTPITRDTNDCLDCHAVEASSGQKRATGTATAIPPSHYHDLRNAPDEKRAYIAGARYVCTSCHVARTDAPPLVENLRRVR